MEGEIADVDSGSGETMLSEYGAKVSVYLQKLY